MLKKRIILWLLPKCDAKMLLEIEDFMNEIWIMEIKKRMDEGGYEA